MMKEGKEKRNEGWYIKLCLGLDATLLPVRGLVDGSLEGSRYNVDTNTRHYMSTYSV